MKRKKHIPVLLFAAFFAVATNGISVYENFCPSGKMASISLFSTSSCNMEKMKNENHSCCSNPSVQRTSDTKSCCHKKPVFEKFSFDGFTSKIFSLKFSELIHFIHANISIEIPIPFLQELFTGLSPPGPDYEIAQYLEPTQPELQVFIC